MFTYRLPGDVVFILNQSAQFDDTEGAIVFNSIRPTQALRKHSIFLLYHSYVGNSRSNFKANRRTTPYLSQSYNLF